MGMVMVMGTCDMGMGIGEECSTVAHFESESESESMRVRVRVRVRVVRLQEVAVCIKKDSPLTFEGTQKNLGR